MRWREASEHWESRCQSAEAALARAERERDRLREAAQRFLTVARGRMHLLLDSELREIKGRMAKALRDPRSELPEAVEEFAAEYGLVWDLDRQFGPLEEVA